MHPSATRLTRAVTVAFVVATTVLGCHTDRDAPSSRTPHAAAATARMCIGQRGKLRKPKDLEASAELRSTALSR